MWLTASLSLVGDPEAREALRRYLALPSKIKTRRPFDGALVDGVYDRIYQGLVMAGMPAQ